MQNRACGGAGFPQLGQDRSRAFPHDMQKRAPGGFSVPQFPQACIAMRFKIRHGHAPILCRPAQTAEYPALGGPRTPGEA